MSDSKIVITYKVMEQISNYRVLVTIKKAFCTRVWSDSEYLYAILGKQVTVAIPIANLIYIENERCYKREQIGQT